MSADRMFTDSEQKYLSNRPKMAGVDGKLIIGTAGDGDICQDILEEIKSFRLQKSIDGYSQMRSIGKLLKDLADDEHDFSVLVGLKTATKPKLYSWENGVILEHSYHAIGSGALVALGAMFVGEGPVAACKAAICHIPGCGGRIDTMELL